MASAAALSAADAKITVAQTADKVTIAGGAGNAIASGKFPLSKDGWYIIKVSYTGAENSICQLALVYQQMIDDDTIVGGTLTNWMGPNTSATIRAKGSARSEDYMIYVEKADGPWTVEILKSPKPSPLSIEAKFSGDKDAVTPFFTLKKGSANFLLNQELESQFSSRLAVDLYNADTGMFVGDLCHNSTAPAQKASVDIQEAGSYILVVSGGDNWNISYTQ